MDDMPDFDTSHETPADAPKKPRRKPMKHVKRRIVAQAAPSKPTKKTRKKRRKVRVARKAVDNGHAVGQFSDEVYRTIGTLMGMKGSDRDTVLDIVKGLTS